MSPSFVRPAGRALAALATTLALVLGTVMPARAAQAWPPLHCATGQFTAIETSADGQTALHGDATPCAPFAGEPAFALVVFHPLDMAASADSRALVWYQSDGPTSFSGLFRSVPTAREAGVCAMRTLTDRMACVRVTWPTDGPAVMAPIPTTDPLVTQYIFYDDEEYPTPPPSGFCGSCLDLPVS
ncbi:hypothetical protein [Plantactinospora sp. B5E13]|uniref:hypothetical protein n=1 Tax=unclassified Plantactinospora TaxID=2631981 RepID=UPI00325EF624